MPDGRFVAWLGQFRLLRRLTEIEIKFRRAPVWMFRSVRGAQGVGSELHRNTLLLTLQPDEGFSLYFDIKAPGEPFRIHRLPLHFNYSEAFQRIPEAYQTLLLDVLVGEQTLFVHADEVEASWARRNDGTLPNWWNGRLGSVGLRVSPGIENDDGADGLRALRPILSRHKTRAR